MRIIDLSGLRFGRLTVLERSGSFRNRPAWRCLCDCGQHTVVRGNSLRYGLTKSCGCLGDESRSSKENKHRTHGMTDTPEYRAWRHIIYRCTKPSSKYYIHYGARGISVCSRWMFGAANTDAFECFFADMGPRPSPRHSIDRIDNDGNYEPENCRWTTQDIQANNRRNTTLITINGATKPLATWAREYGIPASKLRDRMRSGWDPLSALEAGPILKFGPRSADSKFFLRLLKDAGEDVEVVR